MVVTHDEEAADYFLAAAVILRSRGLFGGVGGNELRRGGSMYHLKSAGATIQNVR